VVHVTEAKTLFLDYSLGIFAEFHQLEQLCGWCQKCYFAQNQCLLSASQN